MNELVSVGGICFVAGTPESAESANPRTYTDGYGLERIGTENAEAEAVAQSSDARRAMEDKDHREEGASRKYRKRGERTRQEQWRDAARRYRLEHRDKVREYQRKYRERKRLANETLQWEP